MLFDLFGYLDDRGRLRWGYINLHRLIWASEDDCWERRYWNDKFGGAGEIGVVGGDSSWELLKGGDKCY